MFQFFQKYREQEKRKTILLLIVVLFIFILAIIFRQEVYAGILFVIDVLGYWGLFIISVLMDLILQPFGAGSFVFMSALSGKSFFIAPLVAGFGSSVGGYGGYLIGKKIGIKRFEKLCGKKTFKKTEQLFEKYGMWTVLAGGILPVPYSAVCWAAGIYGMKKRYFIMSCLVTRIPRFLVISLVGFMLL